MLAPKHHPTSVDTTAAPAIPFNRPTIVGRELHYISEAIHNGYSAGNGDFTKACQSLLEGALGAPRVLLTTSCTAALEMAALLLDIGPGDEVIVPSFTFVSTANAFVLRGATPVFADVRPDTLNIDHSQLEELITSRTRAIVPVHYAGVGCEMDVISSIAQKHGIKVIEDNAHGLFGKFRERCLGTWGTFATQSFHETKNFICGEGGAIVINEPSYVARAEILWEKGTNRTEFYRGAVDKYTWVDTGSSYLPSDLLAAFLFAQLEERTTILENRRSLWDYYRCQLSDWADSHDVQLPVVPAQCEQPYHLFYLILPTRELRDAMIAHLKSLGVMSVFHYLPLHLSPMGRKVGRSLGCPITEAVSGRLLRLPFFNKMSESEQHRVVSAVKSMPFPRSTPHSLWPVSARDSERESPPSRT